MMQSAMLDGGDGHDDDDDNDKVEGGQQRMPRWQRDKEVATTINAHNFTDGDKGNNQNNNNNNNNNKSDRVFVMVALIILLGASASTAFMALGITGAHRDQDLRFQRQASEVVKAFQARWADYEGAGLWVHEACRATADQVGRVAGRIKLCTRENFSELYLYLLAGGLEFSSISFFTLILDGERTALEAEAREHYARTDPAFEYRGITGINDYFTADGETGFLNFDIEPRPTQPFYMPAHYVEPFEENRWFVDFDTLSIVQLNETDLDPKSTTLWIPNLSERVREPIHDDSTGYSVFFFHPGIALPTHPNQIPMDAAGMMIHVPHVLRTAVTGQAEQTFAYIFDNDDPLREEPAFLSGARIVPGEDGADLVQQDEIELRTLEAQGDCTSNIIPIGNRRWTVVVCKAGDVYDPSTIYVVLGGITIFVACICLAAWFYTTNRRITRINEIRAAAEHEKASFIVKNAEKAARAERELNEYIAHEIRNPLSAAISACSFVSTALNEPIPLQDDESRASAREDMHIISSSLQFTNDLLRSMLDMQKAVTNRIHLDLQPTCIMKDIFEPVATMLYTRGNNFEVKYDCEPASIVISTDRIRLKQIILNLAGNARKFVEQGFIRLRAEIVGRKVHLSVEDSGPGIPANKRNQLFQKYQESLDTLSQGTGMGLCLCKNLSEILGGSLELDESFDSGIEGCPGSRFVVILNSLPIVMEDDEDSHVIPPHIEYVTDVKNKPDGKCIECSPLVNGTTAASASKSASLVPLNNDDADQYRLPENLSVLVVDDDTILRRLITRTFKRVAPTWDITQAANGETAIRLAEDQKFDLIFMDQYMASVEKQLLGTETTRALRAKGVTACICGLSANNMEGSFLEAGANTFLQKPIPCSNEQVLATLRRILEAYRPCARNQ